MGTSQASVMYITQSSSPENIFSANLDGSALDVIVPGPDVRRGAGRAMAVSPLTGQIFFSHTTLGLRRANLDGSGLTSIPLPPRPGVIVDIEVDAAANKIYLLHEDGGIVRANLDGSGAELIQTMSVPHGIALDPENDALFVTSNSTVYDPMMSIHRMGLNGNGLTKVITLSDPATNQRPGHSAWDIEVDTIEGKLYWANRFTRKIQRANVDGTGVEQLFSHIVFDNLNDFWGPLALDIVNQELYFTRPVQSGTGIVDKGDFGGTSISTVLTFGSAYGLMNIDIGPPASDFSFSVRVPEPTTVALLVVGLVGFSVTARRGSNDG